MRRSTPRGKLYQKHFDAIINRIEFLRLENIANPRMTLLRDFIESILDSPFLQSHYELIVAVNQGAGNSDNELDCDPRSTISKLIERLDYKTQDQIIDTIDSVSGELKEAFPEYLEYIIEQQYPSNPNLFLNHLPVALEYHDPYMLSRANADNEIGRGEFDPLQDPSHDPGDDTEGYRGGGAAAADHERRPLTRSGSLPRRAWLDGASAAPTPSDLDNITRRRLLVGSHWDAAGYNPSFDDPFERSGDRSSGGHSAARSPLASAGGPSAQPRSAAVQEDFLLGALGVEQVEQIGNDGRGADDEIDDYSPPAPNPQNPRDGAGRYGGHDGSRRP